MPLQSLTHINSVCSYCQLEAECSVMKDTMVRRRISFLQSKPLYTIRVHSTEPSGAINRYSNHLNAALLRVTLHAFVIS
jgi:hypothetical protein